MTSSNASWSRVIPHKENQLVTDERYTPEWILKMVEAILGGIDLDPAADPRKRVNAINHFTKEDDGLSKVWSGKIFLNPPFSNSTEWIKHLSLYCLSGSVTEAIILLPVMALSNKSSRLLMHDLASSFLLLERNIAFLDEEYKSMSDSVPFNLALVYVGNRSDQFLSTTEEHGIGCLIRQKKSENIKSAFCKYCGKSYTSKRSTKLYCSTTCRVESHRKRVNLPSTSHPRSNAC